MTTLRECLDNLRDFNISELESVRSRAVFLMGTKQREETRVQNIDRLIAEHQESQGREDGAEWVQPTSAMDAYPVGAVVTHEGQKWRSTTPANPHAPGVAGWRMLSEDGTPPPYVQPSSAADAYQEGERVTFNNQVWEAVRSGVVHSPAEYAPDWRLVEVEPEPEPEPPEDEDDGEPGDDDQDEGGEDEDGEEPVNPDEPGDEEDGDQDDGEPELDEWAPDQDYAAGDELTYDGAQYRVLQSHRSAAHWLPSAVPALYERL